MSTIYTLMPSPIGDLLLTSDGQSLTGLHFPLHKGKRRPAPPAEWVLQKNWFQSTVRQLKEFFAGQRRQFEVPLDPMGTAFQRQVWKALCAIPYGQTRSYGAIAQAIGRPGAARAVGAANGQNPIAIIIPCHRVIGAGGELTGFGGGLPCKQKLLELEKN